MALHIQTGTADPAAAPTEIGQHFVRTDTEELWLSTGNSVLGDWKKLISGVAASNIRIYGGELQIQNATTGLWHSLLCDNNMDGNAELQLEETGVA